MSYDPRSPLDDALQTVIEQSNLSDDEAMELFDMCHRRAITSHDVMPVMDWSSHNAWEMPKVSAWATQHDLAKVLGIDPGLSRQWYHRQKYPPPDDYVNQRPVWARATVKRFCADLVLLAQ